MAILEFPPVELASEEGLLAVGGDLEVESLLLAYKSGIFPWPVHERLLTWFAPPRRAVLFLDRLHVSRRLRRSARSSTLRFEVDCDFQGVITNCAGTRNRRGQRGTWITNDIITGFLAFHEAGFSHSVEAYRAQTLVGGLYGVAIGSMFAGESMFYRERDASKLCLCWLAGYLRERGCSWIDCQVMTPLLKSLGAVEIPRIEFSALLNEAISASVQLFSGPVK